MPKLRLRYQNGQFVPLEPVHGLRDGDEIVAEFVTPAIETLDATLRRTAGMWADVEVTLKQYASNGMRNGNSV